MAVAEKVKGIIVEQLGVDEEEVNVWMLRSSTILGADSLDNRRIGYGV